MTRRSRESSSRTASARETLSIEHLEPRQLLSSLNPTGRDIATLPTGVDSVVVIDITGDGARDLVYSSGNSIYLQAGRGGGGFDTPRVLWQFSNNAGHLAVGDLNNDGRLDIFSAQIAAPTSRFTVLRALLGQAGGGFGPTISSRTDARPQGVNVIELGGSSRILLAGAKRLDMLIVQQSNFILREGAILSTEGALSKPILRELDTEGPIELIIGVSPTAINPEAQVQVYRFQDRTVFLPPEPPFELRLVTSADVGRGVVRSLAAAQLTGDGLRDILATVVENTDALADATGVAGYTGRTVLLEQFIPEVTLPVSPPFLFFRDAVTIHQRFWEPGGFITRSAAPTYEIASVGDINGDGRLDVAIAAVETNTNGRTGSNRTAELFQLYREGSVWGTAVKTHEFTSSDPRGLPSNDRQPVVFALADVRRVGRPDLITFSGPSIDGPITARLFFNTNALKAPVIESVSISPFGPIVGFPIGSELEVGVPLFIPDFASGSTIQSVRIYVDSNRNGLRDAGDLFVGDATPPITAGPILPPDPSRTTWFLQAIVAEQWGLGSQVLLAEVVDNRGLTSVGASRAINILRLTT